MTDLNKLPIMESKSTSGLLLTGSFLVLTMSYLASLFTIASGDRDFDLGILFYIDTLRPWLVYRDAFLLEDYSVWGWRHGVAPFFFPDFAILWTLFAMGVDFRVAMYVSPLLLALVSIGGWISVCNTLFDKSIHRQTAVILLHATPFALTAAGLNDFYQLHFFAAGHYGTWAILPWLLLFFLKTHSKALPRGKSVAGSMVAYGSLLAAASASNLIVVVWFVVPAYCALAIAEMTEKEGHLTSGEWIRRIVVTTAGVFGGAAVWFMLPFSLNRSTEEFLTPTLNPEKMLFVLEGIATTFFDVSARDPLNLTVWILFSCLTLWRLCTIFRKAERKKAKEGRLMNLLGVPRERKHVFMAVFIPFAMLTPVAANIATGNFSPNLEETAGLLLRYIGPFLYFPLFVGWFLLPWNGVKRARLHFSSAAALAFAFALSGIAAITSWPGLKKLDPFATPFQDCFSQHANRLDWRGGIVTKPFFPLVANPNTDVDRILYVLVGSKRDKVRLVWTGANRHWFSGDFQFVALNAFKGRLYGRPPMIDGDKGCPIDDFGQCLNSALTMQVLDESAVLSALGEPAEVIDCAGIGFFHYDPPIRLDFSNSPHTGLFSYDP